MGIGEVDWGVYGIGSDRLGLDHLDGQGKILDLILTLMRSH